MTASSLQIAAGKSNVPAASPPRKGRIGNIPKNLFKGQAGKAELWQDKHLCAAGDECKMGALPLAPSRHRCGACGFAMHGPCGYEVWSDNPYNLNQSEVYNSVCFACVWNRRWTRFLVKQEHTTVLSLKHKEPLEEYKKTKAVLRLVDNGNAESKKAKLHQEGTKDVEMKDADQTHQGSINKGNHQMGTPQRGNRATQNAEPSGMEMDSDDSSTGDQTVHMASLGTSGQTKGSKKGKTDSRTDSDPETKRPAGPESQHPTRSPGTTQGKDKPQVTRLFLDIKVPIGQPTEKDAGAGYRNLKDKLVDFLNGIHQIIPTFKLCELRSPQPELDSKIHDLSRFPERLEELRTYVRQAYIPNRNSEILYSKILAEWEGDTSNLRDLDWWMNQHNMAIYIAKLQTPDHMRIGWFLYSVQSMGADDLAEKLKDIAKRKYRIQKPLIAMRWSRIANKEKALPDDPKAMQIDVAYDQVDDIKRMLRDLYSPQATTFPLHMRMRFVVGMDELGSPESVAKFNRLRARQGLWVAQSVGRVTTDLMNIDYTHPLIGKSLRDLIAEIPATTGTTTTPLIHSIGRHYRGGYYCTCHPRKAAEAQMTMNGLYARLHYQYKELINQYFTPGGINRAAGMTFDPTTGKVRTEGDDIIENIELLDDDLILEATTPTETPIPQREVLVEERTVDSVSTLGGGGGGGRTVSARSRTRDSNLKPSSTRSVDSLDSRVTAMEDTLSVIMQSMQDIKQSLAANSAQNLSTPRTNPSGVHGETDQRNGAQPPVISPHSRGAHSQSASAGQADKDF